MTKADIKKLQQLLKQMDSDEKRLQLNYGDVVKSTQRSINKGRAESLRKLLKFYEDRQTKWIGE